jgi:hypothetical protein
MYRFTVLDAHGKETPGRLFLSITLLPDPPSLREQTRKALAYGGVTAPTNQVRHIFLEDHTSCWGELTRFLFIY